MKIELLIFENGIKSWYKDGAYHREGEHPSVIYPKNVVSHHVMEEYHINGKLIKIVRDSGEQFLLSRRS
jgi:hypothetical protein